MKKILFLIFILLVLFTMGLACDYDAKTLRVLSCNPANHSLGITSDQTVKMSFSARVNKTDVMDNLNIYGTEGAIRGRFTWHDATSFTYVPEDELSVKGKYVIELPRTVRDSKGNVMSSDFISDFYVGTDFVIPEVIESTPPFTEVAVDGIAVDCDIKVDFSKSMDRASVEGNFSITPSVTGYFIWSESASGLPDSSFTYKLTSTMSYGRLYSFTVDANTTDLTGNKIGKDYRVNFITGDDFTPPEVVEIYDQTVLPLTCWTIGSMNYNVSRDAQVSVVYSEPMNKQSAEESFSITPSVQGNFQWYGDTNMVFIPSALLNPETRYLISPGSSAKDFGGLKLNQSVFVEIFTNSPKSLYVKCGRILFSNDGNTYTNMFEGTPLFSDWPIPINMGEDTNSTLFLKIEFVSGLIPYEPVRMNSYSIYGNCLIETFKASSDYNYPVARIDDIIWADFSTVIFKITGMTNSSVYNPALYRFTVSGSANGVTDESENYMKEDLVFEFREATS